MQKRYYRQLWIGEYILFFKKYTILFYSTYDFCFLEWLSNVKKIKIFQKIKMSPTNLYDGQSVLDNFKKNILYSHNKCLGRHKLKADFSFLCLIYILTRKKIYTYKSVELRPRPGNAKGRSRSKCKFFFSNQIFW